MSTLTNKSTNRPIDSLIEYIQEVKPYHTKFLEIVEIYNFNESMNIQFLENCTTSISFHNKALCSPVGYGIEWDESCGFDPLSCCDLFECVGSYGLIFDNSDILISEPIISLNPVLGSVTLNGDFRFDTKFQISSIPNNTSIIVKGDIQTDISPHNLLLISPLKIFKILNITNNEVVISGLHSTLFTNNTELNIINDTNNTGTHLVLNATEGTNSTTLLINGALIPSNSGLGNIEIHFNCKNQGAYQIAGVSFDGIQTTINITGTNALDFTDLTETVKHGAVHLRSGLISPRRIMIVGNSVDNDRDYKIINTSYDNVNNETTLTLNGTLLGNSATGLVQLIGYQSGHGFDGFDECSVPKPHNIHNNFSEYLDIIITNI